MARDAVADKPSAKALESARTYVAQRWPELAGVEPTISKRERPSAAGKASGAKSAQGTHYVLTFRKTLKTPDGHSLPRTARVTIDEQGQVVKATSSK